MPYGFNAQCFRLPEDRETLRQFLFRVHQCKTQSFYARVIELMSRDEVTEFVALIESKTHGQCQINWHPSDGTLPAIVTIIHPDYAVAIADGTRNFQQIALQGLFFLQGPQNFGQFATMPLWHTAGQTILQTLKDDGYNFNGSVCFVGHSYGGAAACIAAIKLGVPNDRARRDVLTFGMPKPGDQRLVDRLHARQAVHLVNHDDIVTILPPDLILLNPVAAVLGQFVNSLWPDWVKPFDQQRQAFNGSLQFADADAPDFDTLLNVVESAINNVPLDPVAPHYIQEYIKRLRKRCPDPVAGALVLTDPRPAGGVLRLVDVRPAEQRLRLVDVAPAQGAIRLIPGRGDCPCCPFTASAGNINVTTTSTDVPDFDNVTFLLTRGSILGQGCQWFNSSHTEGDWFMNITFQSTLNNPTPRPAGLIKHNPTGNQWLALQNPVQNFECVPWGFDTDVTFVRSGDANKVIHFQTQ